jgi:penicillin-binding protein 1A
VWAAGPDAGSLLRDELRRDKAPAAKVPRDQLGKPEAVDRADDKGARVLGPTTPEVLRRAVKRETALAVTTMMEHTVSEGTSFRAFHDGRGKPFVQGVTVAGKTGTSNQSKDTWFAGFSPETTAVVWVGYDDGKSLGGAETGATAALPAWIDFMKVASEHRPPSPFPRPAGIVEVTIDKKTGKLPPDGDADTMSEIFLAGTEPTEIAKPVEDGGADAGPSAP